MWRRFIPRVGKSVLGCAAVTVLALSAPLAVPERAETVAPCDAAPVGSWHGEAPMIRWERVAESDERSALDRWCAGVGPPLLAASGSPGAGARSVDRIAIVSWNVHVGGGAVSNLLADLRAGRLGTSGPTHDVILLLQEALRIGDEVPGGAANGAPGGSRIVASPPDGERIGLAELARREGLFAFYAPSMRNGSNAREDRGNAILSTLPLTELVALELPFERQRRIALSARVNGRDSAGAPWTLGVVSAHLDNWSAWNRLARSFGRGRARQARAIADLFGDDAAVALGGDFNTWFGQNRETAVEILRRRFPAPERHPNTPTHETVPVLFRRKVDYLFFRLPEGWRATYRVLEDKRGSDHAPLLGEVVFDAKASAAARGS